MKKLFTLGTLCILIYACNSNTSENKATDSGTATEQAASSPNTSDYDPNRGQGKFDKVDVGSQLDAAMATEGETIANLKCASCHKYSDEKLVGPGWKGVSERRQPEWIMNFITNPDAMLDQDPALQAQLELCLVRMPNQNLTDDDARKILEFMRKNDGVK